MPRNRKQYLVREKSRHGNWVWYVRVSRQALRVRIRAEFGTAEFDAQVEAAIAGTLKIMERVDLLDGHRVITRDAYTDFVGFAAREGFSGTRLPAVHNFVQRLVSQDPRIKGGGRAKSGRYFEGLRLRLNNVSH